jgi:hypothetical protein
MYICEDWGIFFARGIDEGFSNIRDMDPGKLYQVRGCLYILS